MRDGAQASWASEGEALEPNDGAGVWIWVKLDRGTERCQSFVYMVLGNGHFGDLGLGGQTLRQTVGESENVLIDKGGGLQGNAKPCPERSVDVRGWLHVLLSSSDSTLDSSLSSAEEFLQEHSRAVHEL